jgi:3-hydroxyacyl-[acyl-carrier-protein] dehydratase
MPGVLIVEAMAQAAILLFYREGVPAREQKSAYYLCSLKAKFKNSASCGDQLKITVEPVKMVSHGAIVSAVAQAGDKEIAAAELGFIIKED